MQTPTDNVVTFFAAPPSELCGIYVNGDLATVVTGVEHYWFTTGNSDDVLFGGEGDDRFEVNGGNNYIAAAAAATASIFRTFLALSA